MVNDEGWWSRLALLSKVTFGLLFLLVSYLALTPQPVDLSSSNDKSDHLLAFFSLTLLLRHGWPNLPPWRTVFGVMLGYGIAIELLQLLVPDRDGSLLDIVADLAGILLALGASRRWLAPRERIAAK